VLARAREARWLELALDEIGARSGRAARRRAFGAER
jgi:hypothetical protein